MSTGLQHLRCTFGFLIWDSGTRKGKRNYRKDCQRTFLSTVDTETCFDRGGKIRSTRVGPGDEGGCRPGTPRGTGGTTRRKSK